MLLRPMSIKWNYRITKNAANTFWPNKLMGLYWEVLPTIHWGSINSSSNSTLRSRTVHKMFVFVHIYLYILSNLRFLRLKYIIHWIKYILFSSNTPFRCIVVLCHFQCKRLMNLGAESLFFLCFYFFSFFSFFFLKNKRALRPVPPC